MSQQNFDTMPWIVIDFKGDALINEIANLTGALEIDVNARVPEQPGIYVMHVRPDQEIELDEFLWRVWNHEYVGLYVDEGYMLEKSKAFDAILTQGRSKHIPVVILSQRPVWLSRFVFSEANFFQVFHLNDVRDRKTIRGFVPAKLDKRLPEYHSYYYDVDRDKLDVFAPVPNEAKILARINARLPRVEERRTGTRPL